MKIFRGVGWRISAVQRVSAAFFHYALTLGSLYPFMAEYFGIRATFALSLPLVALSFWAAKSLKN